MTTGTLKGAVIGCGFFAQNHLHGWADIDGVEIVAVCDLDAEKARAAADRFSIARVYTDARALFESEALDFVDIPTTAETHEALVGLAVEHGVPVIVQKPFAPEIAAAKRMVAKAAAAGVPLAVHEDFRFQNLFRHLKGVLAAGELGRLTFARLSWRTEIDVYANQPYLLKEKRFIISDVGIHILDLARFLLGEGRRVFCHTQQIRPGLAGEDAATLLIDHEGGAASVIDISYAAKRDPDPFPETLGEIEGTEGSVLILPDERLRIHTRTGGTREVAITADGRPWTYEPWTQIQDSVVHTQRHFIESLRAGRPAETSGADSLNTYALLEAAYLSAETGRFEIPDRF